MLAPPDKRRRDKLKRRAADRRYQRDCRARKKAGLHRCTLWISSRAYEGLLNQLILTGQLTDKQSTNHQRFEVALAGLIERQGGEWTR